MRPETPSSGSGTDAFAEMTASMPSYGEHIVNQVGLAPESPPTSTNESQSSNPPVSEQSQTSMQNQQESTIAATSVPETSLGSTTTNTATTDTATSTSENSKSAVETITGLSPEELADIQEYADKLETGAKKDQEVADLLHRILSDINHQTSAPSAKSTESAPSSNTPNAPQNTSEQPSPTPQPAIPDAATAIAEALAETADISIPGQVPISTPPESPASSFSSVATGGVTTTENPAVA